jgi:hypothetical protein
MAMVGCCLRNPRNFLILLELYRENTSFKHEGIGKKVNSTSSDVRKLLGLRRHQTAITINHHHSSALTVMKALIVV